MPISIGVELRNYQLHVVTMCFDRRKGSISSPLKLPASLHSLLSVCVCVIFVIIIEHSLDFYPR